MRKIGLISLVLVLAMGLLGVGYAMWSEVLTITGTVNTGEVDASFTGAFTDDDGTENDVTKDLGDTGGGTDYDRNGASSSDDPKESVANPQRYPKDVAMSTATFDGLTGTVTIENGYPSYYTTAYFEITNNGTIPVRVLIVEEHCNVDHWVSFDDGKTWVLKTDSTWYEVTPSVTKLIDFNNDGMADLAVHITTIVLGTQLDPGDTILMDVDIHVEQGAAELAGVDGSGIDAYTFDERVTLAQWNEVPPPAGG